MNKKKIAVCYFSYWKDIDFLNESLKVLEDTIARHPEYEVKTYVFDDARARQRLKKKDIYGSPTLISTTFDRKGNLNGFECIDGMFNEYKKIAAKFDYDYLIKLDSDCVLNSLDYISKVEVEVMKAGGTIESIGQIGSFFASICVCGCCQTFGKAGIATICNLFSFMNRGSNQQEIIMKKRVERGYNEDKVVSVLLEMSPVLRINLDTIPNTKGNCNAFMMPDDVNYGNFTSVAFKPNVFANTSTWNRAKSLDMMKKFVNSKKKLMS